MEGGNADHARSHYLPTLPRLLYFLLSPSRRVKHRDALNNRQEIKPEFSISTVARMKRSVIRGLLFHAWTRNKEYNRLDKTRLNYLHGLARTATEGTQ
jgi:hypothetical protein